MSKTANRVLAMVLTAIMLLSMLPAIALAASPFSTAYNGTVISKAALLVDMTITESNGATITRKWDGTDYTFVVGTNAFNTLNAAYTYAKSKSMSKPDIIVTGWTAGTDLTVEMNSNVYAVNWNTAPMNEMKDSFKAVTSNGAAWTENETYTTNAIAIGSLKAAATVTGDITISGFTVNGAIDVASSRTTSSATVNFLIKNTRLNASGKVLSNISSKQSNVIRMNKNTSATATDTLTFKNFWLDKVASGDTSRARVFGDGNFYWPNVVFDTMYADLSAMEMKGSTNDHMKTYAKKSSVVFKNSNLRNATSSIYWQMNQCIGASSTTDYTRTITFDNNIMYNFNNASGYVINNIGNIADNANHYYGVPNVINVTNNLVWNTTAAKLAVESGKLSAKASTTETIKFTISGNSLLGVTSQTYSSATIANNYYCATANTSLSAYNTVKGVAYAGSATYCYDRMAQLSNQAVTATSLTGASISHDYKTITVFTNAAPSEKVSLSSFTIPNAALTKELYSDPQCTTPITEYALSSVPATSYGITTVYLKVYYSATSNIYSVYRIQLVNPSATSFNDLLKKGISIKGYYFTAADTAVYLPKGDYATKDGYVYAKFAPHGLKFKVDNVNVFANNGADLSKLSNFKNIILPAGEYGDLNITFPANFYGSNGNTNPNDKSIATAENDFDWGLNPSWDSGNSTKVGVVKIGASVTGSVVLDGFTVTGKVVDQDRDSLTLGSLALTLKNMVIDAPTITGNAIIFTNNDRSYNTTDTTNAAKNNDTLTVQNCYVAATSTNQIFEETNYPFIEIDGLYWNPAVSGQKRSTLAFFKNGTANTHAKFVAKNSNLRGSTDGYQTFMFYDSPNGIDIDIENNILVTNKTNVFYTNSSTRVYGDVIVNNNTIISNVSTALSNTFATPSGTKSANKNRIMGVSSAQANICGLTLTNTFYSANPNAHERPTGITGGYATAMGQTDGKDNAYYLDYNMTKLSTSYDAAKNFSYLLTGGIVANGVSLNKTNAAVLLPPYLAPGTDGYSFLNFNGTVYKFKAGDPNVFANAGSSLASVGAYSNVILPAGDYGALTFSIGQNIYGSSLGKDPSDRTVANADNKLDWAFSSKWDIDNSTNIKGINLTSSVAGTMKFDGIKISQYVHDVSRLTTNSAVNFSIENSVIDVPTAYDWHYVINLTGPRTKSGNTVTNNADTFTLKNVYVLENDASHLFHETIYPNTVIDGLYWNTEVSGQDRAMLGIHKIYGTHSGPTYTIKNSNLRAIEGSDGYATVRFDAPNGVKINFDNNIFYFNHPSQGLLNTNFSNTGTVKINNNILIDENFGTMFTGTGAGSFAAGSEMKGNRFLGFPASKMVTGNLALTDTYYSLSLSGLTKPTANTGAYTAAMGTNAYYLDYYMTKLSSGVGDSFNDLLAAGITIGDKTLTTENTAVYLSTTGDGEGKAALNFLGETYTFVIDNVNVFANAGSDLTAVSGFENIILPSGDYGQLVITKTANIYGSNAGINPSIKDNATAENNYDWEFNPAWDKENSTLVHFKVDAGVTGGELVIDGVALREYRDNYRTLASAALNATVVNSVFDDNAGFNYHAIFYTGNARSANSTNETVAAANKDTLLIKDCYALSISSNQILDEINVPHVILDGVYIDAQASGKKRSIISFFKTSILTDCTITIKNSNLRNGTNANGLFTIGGSKIDGIGSDGKDTGVDVYPVDAKGSLHVYIDNNIVYNPHGTSGGPVFNPYVNAISSYNVTNNTIINTKGSAYLFLATVGATALDANNQAVTPVASQTKLFGNFRFDNNRVAGFTNLEIDPAYGVVTNSFLSTDGSAPSKPDAVLGKYIAAMGTNAYYLDYNMKQLSGQGGQTINSFNDVIKKGLTINGTVFTSDNTAVYLPQGSLDDTKSTYGVFAGEIYKFTVDALNVFENKGTDLSEVVASGKTNVILPAGTYGELIVTGALNFYGSNFGISPNDKSVATGENGFDWAFNSDWDYNNSSVVTNFRVVTTSSIGAISIDGVTLAMYIDNTREEAVSVGNVTIKNSVFENAGDGNAVIHTNNKRSMSATVGGSDKLVIQDCYVKSMKSNQFLHEWNVPVVEINGLYLDGQAAGKNRPILSFFKTQYGGRATITIKNSNLRNGGTANGTNGLFTVTGAVNRTASGDIYSNKSVSTSTYVQVTIENNIVYNGNGDATTPLFYLYADSIRYCTIKGNTIIDTKGNSLIELGKGGITDVKGSMIDNASGIKFENNSIVGIDSGRLNFNLGLNNNPVLKSSYYSPSIAGLSDIYANTGMKHKAMGTQNYYADVARTQWTNSFTPVVGTTVVKIGNTGYETIEEALEKATSGQTVTLVSNVDAAEVIIAPGVKVELNGFALTSDYVNGFNGSDIVDTSAEKTGRLVAEQGTVKHAKDNDQLSVYDAENGYYVFTTIQMAGDTIGTRYDYEANNVARRYRFFPFLYEQGNLTERELVHGILKEQYANSGVSLGVRLTYEATNNYTAHQDYMFVTEYATQYVTTSDEQYVIQNGKEVYGKLYVIFSQPLLEQGENTRICGFVQSDTGIEITSAATVVG